MDYDPNNIFAKILRGEIPAHRIYEDEATLAFMDVMPQADGHALVVPKAPSRNLLDADPAILGPLLVVAQKVALASQKAFQAPGVLVKQFNEAASGQTVFHLHVHIIPCQEGVALRGHGRAMANSALLSRHAEMMRAALA